MLLLSSGFALGWQGPMSAREETADVFFVCTYYPGLNFSFLHRVTTCRVKNASSCRAIHMAPVSPDVWGITLSGDLRGMGLLYQKAAATPAFGNNQGKGKQQYKTEAQ